ncbi:MAG: hypothetical protein IJK84_01315 [Bacteroidales bacterium]|nr:hypothetical protein [Bacteroidales bacterium]
MSDIEDKATRLSNLFTRYLFVHYLFTDLITQNNDMQTTQPLPFEEVLWER